jgi:hypothetical protein
MALKEAVALRHLIGRGNDDERKLNLAVVGHNWFSELGIGEHWSLMPSSAFYDKFG